MIITIEVKTLWNYIGLELDLEMAFFSITWLKMKLLVFLFIILDLYLLHFQIA